VLSFVFRLVKIFEKPWAYYNHTFVKTELISAGTYSGDSVIRLPEWKSVPVLVISCACEEIRDVLFTTGAISQRLLGEHAYIGIWFFFFERMYGLCQVFELWTNNV
jgi:hypothetical protein